MHPRTGPRATASRRRSFGAPVLAYDTEVCEEGRWEAARSCWSTSTGGGPADVAELAWRSEGGAEATIAFDGGMKAFHGHRRAIDGSVRQYRGAAAGSRPAPEEIPDCRVRTFVTEEDGDSAGAVSGVRPGHGADRSMPPRQPSARVMPSISRSSSRSACARWWTAPATRVTPAGVIRMPGEGTSSRSTPG